MTHLCMQYSLLPCFFGKVAECNRSYIPNQVAAPQKLSVIGVQTFRQMYRVVVIIYSQINENGCQNVVRTT